MLAISFAQILSVHGQDFAELHTCIMQPNFYIVLFKGFITIFSTEAVLYGNVGGR